MEAADQKLPQLHQLSRLLLVPVNDAFRAPSAPVAVVDDAVESLLELEQSSIRRMQDPQWVILSYGNTDHSLLLEASFSDPVDPDGPQLEAYDRKVSYEFREKTPVLEIWNVSLTEPEEVFARRTFLPRILLGDKEKIDHLLHPRFLSYSQAVAALAESSSIVVHTSRLEV